MSNPTLLGGVISVEAAEKLAQFTLVKLNEDGKAVVAGADGAVFGAVTEKRDPENPLSSKLVAVHFAPHVVRLKVAGGDASGIKAGAAVYAAAAGEVAASGSVQVGVAARAGADGAVLVALSGLPHAAS